MPGFDLNLKKVSVTEASLFAKQKRSTSTNSNYQVGRISKKPILAGDMKDVDLSDPIQATDVQRKEAGEFRGGKIRSISPKP